MTRDSQMNDYGRFCRPNLVELLKAMGVGAPYERAEGDFLWQNRDGRLVKVLDLVGGYGALLFGHNHPELVNELQRALCDKTPMLAQGSVRSSAGKLARVLNERLGGDYMVIFTNSGTETVEAAMKHAYLERERPVFWAVKGGFHGKTLGSIQLTWSYAAPFKKLGPSVKYLDPDDPRTWEEAAQSLDEVAGVVVEPIRGEGGIKALPSQFAAWLSETTKKAGIPLIADEIQTGMGRTGHFLGSQLVGLDPDYVCLSKALGGGLVKIGALLIKRERFVDEFSMIHTSTFAEDELSCRVALKALEILDRDQLPEKCAEAGEYLLDGLHALKAEFPEQVKEVRGAGLMLGLELRDHSNSPSNTFLMLSRQKYFGYAASAYLLMVHNVRVAPTLSEPFTLRLEPSAYITQESMDLCLGALRDYCELLRCEDAAPLVRQQLGKPQAPFVDYRGYHPSTRQESKTDLQVGFLGNLIGPESVEVFDPSLASLPFDDLESYLSQSAQFIAPCVYDSVNVKSDAGGEVHLRFVGLGITAAQIMDAMKNDSWKWVLEKVREGVDLAAEEGCTVVGLGGHTSIVSANGLYLRGCKPAITSGNALTVGMAIMAVQRAVKKLGICTQCASVAVVGATGNIGSTCATILARDFGEVYLVGRSLTTPRLLTVAEDIRNAAPGKKVHLADNLDVLKRCSVVVSASNAAHALIYPEHLARGPVVVCDISVPGDVHESVSEQRPDAEVIHSPLVKLPHNPDFKIAGIPLRKGHVLPCMAETLLMGLENAKTNGSYGQITPERVRHMCQVAQKHGFTLAD
jgi:acetylornithine/succinyldiaminopimelate/putrescine aminotransferase/predicted amino acid dehydrogenase